MRPMILVLGLMGVSLEAAEWRLDLADACSAKRPVQLFIRERNGIVVDAFALAPTFTKACGRVEAANLLRQGAAWKGKVTLEFPSDGWNPPQGHTFKIEADLMTGLDGSLKWVGRRGDEAAEGAVSLQSLKSSSPTNPVLLSLVALQGNPSSRSEPGAKSRAKNLQIRMALCGDRVERVILREQASPVDTGNDLVVTRQDILFRDGKWRGPIEAEAHYQDDRRAFPLTWQLETTLIGDTVAGSLTVLTHGVAGKSLLVSGSVLPAADEPGQALVFPLVLNGALPNGGNLECYLEFQSNRVMAAFATGPNANNATHGVDANGVRWAAGRLRGTMGIVLQADPWTPPDHLPLPLIVGIDAAVSAAGAAVHGRFEGHRGSQPVSGTVEGLLQPRLPRTPPMRATIKFEDGLSGAGAKAWLRRAFVGVTLDAGGQVTGGKVFNNHSTLTGTVDSGVFRCLEGRLEGEVKIVAGEGNVTPGPYHFRFKGPLVGDMATGLFELLGKGDEVLKTGSFWAVMDRAPGTPVKQGGTPID